MGFGSILDLFKRDNWSNELVDKISEMLELGSAMFDYTSGVLVVGNPDSDPQALLYDRDIRINKLERTIRRSVISHLSVRGSRAEVPSALIFMNVVKDAERIGDYIKASRSPGSSRPRSRTSTRSSTCCPTRWTARCMESSSMHRRR